jgi:hypothetical protein
MPPARQPVAVDTRQPVPVDGRHAAPQRKPRHISLMAALNGIMRDPAAHFRRLPPEDPRPYLDERDQLGSYSPLREVQGLPTPSPAPRLTPEESKRSAPPAMPVKGLRSIIWSKRFWRRSLFVLSLSATVIGVTAYALLNRGGIHAGSRQAAPATNARGDLVDVPLPSRRPATLRAPSRDPFRLGIFGD